MLRQGWLTQPRMGTRINANEGHTQCLATVRKSLCDRYARFIRKVMGNAPSGRRQGITLTGRPHKSHQSGTALEDKQS